MTTLSNKILIYILTATSALSPCIASSAVIASYGNGIYPDINTEDIGKMTSVNREIDSKKIRYTVDDGTIGSFNTSIRDIYTSEEHMRLISVKQLFGDLFKDKCLTISILQDPTLFKRLSDYFCSRHGSNRDAMNTALGFAFSSAYTAINYHYFLQMSSDGFSRQMAVSSVANGMRIVSFYVANDLIGYFGGTQPSQRVQYIVSHGAAVFSFATTQLLLPFLWAQQIDIASKRKHLRGEVLGFGYCKGTVDDIVNDKSDNGDKCRAFLDKIEERRYSENLPLLNHTKSSEDTRRMAESSPKFADAISRAVYIQGNDLNYETLIYDLFPHMMEDDYKHRTLFEPFPHMSTNVIEPLVTSAHINAVLKDDKFINPIKTYLNNTSLKGFEISGLNLRSAIGTHKAPNLKIRLNCKDTFQCSMVFKSKTDNTSNNHVLTMKKSFKADIGIMKKDNPVIKDFPWLLLPDANYSNSEYNSSLGLIPNGDEEL